MVEYKRLKSKQQAPDGGWGWAVCFGSFILQVLIIGMESSFGIIFVDLIRYFHSTQAVTAWVGSIQAFCQSFSGLMTAPLLHRFGWRALTITGGMISALGYGASALASNVYILYFTYGVLTGIGNGFMYITSIVIIQPYFSKNRAIANGISASGSGVGSLIYGVITQYIISALGWQLMLVINAGLTLVCAIGCGILFRPLPQDQPILPESDKPTEQTQPKLVTITEDNKSNNEYTSDLSVSISASDEPVQAIAIRRTIPVLSMVPSVIEESGIFDYEIIEVPLEAENLPLKRGKIYYSISGIYQIWIILKNMIDFTLYKNCVFNLFTFAVIMYTYSFLVSYNFVPEWGMTVGATYAQASSLISVIGLSSIFTRLFCGWVADKLPNRRFDILGAIITLEGILALTSGAFVNYPLLIVFCVLFGFCIGGINTLYPVVLVDLLGREMFDKALGLVFVSRSFICLIAGPISGYIITANGIQLGVIIAFMVTGAGLCLSGLGYFLINCFSPKPDDWMDTKPLTKSQEQYDVKHAIEEAEPFDIDTN